MGYCKTHNTETNLRCSQCNDFICPRCSISAPVGYKCPNCVKKLETHLDKISVTQYIMASTGTLAVLAIGILLVNTLSLNIILSILIGIAAGYAAGQVAYFASGRKLGRKIQYLYGILWLVMVITILLLFSPAWFGIGHSLSIALMLIFGIYKLQI